MSGRALEDEDGNRKAESQDHDSKPDSASAEKADQIALTSSEPFRLTPQERSREWTQFLVLCFAIFTVGWTDGTSGPLIPTMQLYWDLDYTIVSMIFIFNTVGVLVGVTILVLFGNRFGFGKLIVFGALTMVVSNALQASRPPGHLFPVFVLGFFFGGISLALIDAQANSYVACLKEQASLKMGLLHAAYGLGAFCSPLIATQFAPTRQWSFHYLVSLGLALANAALLSFMFKFKRQEDLIAQYYGHSTDTTANQLASKKSNYKAVLSHKNVYLLAIFCLIYVGVEVTTGGWIVTFIIRERGGGRSSGYVSSGFFGGLTIGRVVLIWINAKVGEYRVIFIYAFICLGLEIVIWLTHSLVGDAIAVSFIGMLLGPMYPIMISQAEKVLPRPILVSAVACITALGAAGAAIFPFIAGALAGRFGIVAMEPLLIILLCIMCLLWALVPSRAQDVKRGPEKSGRLNGDFPTTETSI